MSFKIGDRVNVIDLRDGAVVEHNTEIKYLTVETLPGAIVPTAYAGLTCGYAVSVACLRLVEESPVEEPLILAFRWKVNSNTGYAGDLYLMAGTLTVGEVFWLAKDDGREWQARGLNICTHTSYGHATREAAQAALLAAVRKLAG